MFPGPGAQVYYNEAGEPLGWDYPSVDPYDDYDRDPYEEERRYEWLQGLYEIAEDEVYNTMIDEDIEDPFNHPEFNTRVEKLYAERKAAAVRGEE